MSNDGKVGLIRNMISAGSLFSKPRKKKKNIINEHYVTWFEMVYILWLPTVNACYILLVHNSTILQYVNRHKNKMCSILVTGANRGIGLGLVKHLLSNQAFKVENVFATCRDKGKAKELMELENNSQLHILETDLIDHGSFFNLASHVSNIVKDKGLNVLINNAGISSKFTRIGLVKSEDLLNHFKINTIGPIMLTQALLPLLKTASEKNQSSTGVNKAVIVNMSSILGSLTLNDQGGFYPYRTSKAAINVATKSLSVDLKNNGILTVSIHPGWVKTAMGGANAPLEVEQSVSGICKFLNNINKSHNGGFYDFEGKVLPW